MTTLEIIIILSFYTVFSLIFVYFYLRSKVSDLRIGKIKDYMNAREHDFTERFRSGINEFREANINLQHDFIRFDRLREGIEGAFKVMENRMVEVTRFTQDMEKTSSFYQDLQNTLKENNQKLQDFIGKLNVFENDFKSKEEEIQGLEGILNQVKDNFQKEIINLQTDFESRLQEVEKNIHFGYERVINLSKVNADKMKQQYVDLEADFKDEIDTLVKEEKQHIQKELQEMRSGSESQIVSLQVDLRKQEDQMNSLMERYGNWEREIVEHREKTQNRIDRFSENVLSTFKEKIDDYQKEILALLEQKYKKMNEQTSALEKRNQLKQDAVEGIYSFLEESRKTITYQINNLSDFLEEQKKIQNTLYQKNRLVLVDAFNDLRGEFTQLQEEIGEVKEKRKTLLEEIYNLMDARLHQGVSEMIPQMLGEVFDEKTELQRSSVEHVELIEGMSRYFDNKVKDYVKGNAAWLMEVLKEDSGWQSFLEEQARLKLIDKINTQKLKQQYADLEAKFKDAIDNLVKKERERLLMELQEIQAGPGMEIVSLEANLQKQEEQATALLRRYEDWEKEISVHQQEVRERIDRFTDTVMTDIKKRMEVYQEETMVQLEGRHQKIDQETSELEDRNQLKKEALDRFYTFVDEAQKTVHQQLGHLSDFLEEQKKNQENLYQKNRVDLVDNFDDLKSDFNHLQEDLAEFSKNKKYILGDIDEYLEARLHRAIMEEAPRILGEVFNEEVEIHLTNPEHKKFLRELDGFLSRKIKDTVSAHTSWVLEKLQEDPQWQTFLEKQVRSDMFRKVKTEKIFNELKRSFSKDYLRRELQEEVKTYRKEIEGIDKNWKKLSGEVEERKKFLDRILVQGEDKIEHLMEGIKLNLADKEQDLQDLFNERIIGMEKKMSTVTERIDFFLDKTKSVDKIFLFQKEFTEAMGNYQKQLVDLKKSEKRFSEFRENFQKLEKENQRLKIMHQGLADKESKISSLEKQLETVMGMTGEIQSHIEKVNQQTVEIDEFLKNLQSYNQDIMAIKKEFGGFKKLQEDFQEVKVLAEEIQAQSQQNQEKTEIFLSRVTAGEELQKKISDHIKEMEESSLKLDVRYKAMEYFNKKFDEFDMAVYDVEKRIETIKSLKKEMVVEQENLNELKEGFNEQISIILRVFQYQREKANEKPLFTELDKKFKSLPQTLSHIGWSDKEIAKHLNMELYEVQLLLNPKKRKK